MGSRSLQRNRESTAHGNDAADVPDPRVVESPDPDGGSPFISARVEIPVAGSVVSVVLVPGEHHRFRSAARVFSRALAKARSPGQGQGLHVISEI